MEPTSRTCSTTRPEHLSHAGTARGSRVHQIISDHSDVLSFFALFAGRSIELDALTLFEALVAITLDAGEMYKDVITLLARDEAETLFCVKKLYCALCHDYSILDATD
jgi:hypothetical protein